MIAEFDVIVWGASGFTGRLVAEYIAENYGIGRELRWAIAGRQKGKLEALRTTLVGNDEVDSLPILIADSSNRKSLDALVRQTKVICTTVGPYALYGTALVEACVEAGTDYCDLTGEVQWMHRIIESQEDKAKETGARIVHTCGFDSIPSDLGTYFAQEKMMERQHVYAKKVTARMGRSSGSASGGTIASLLNVLDEAKKDPAIRRVMGDPYSLCHPSSIRGKDGSDQSSFKYDTTFSQWTSPFVMATINGRVVRRSNALLNYRWGEDFQYDEAQLCKSLSKAIFATAAMGIGIGLVSFAPTRNLVEKRLPKPGEGPDEAARIRGFFEMFIHASHPDHAEKDLRVKVTGDRDPGYGSTSKMLAESAICLALDEKLSAGGIWTPSSALGSLLIDRLIKNAGLSFELAPID